MIRTILATAIIVASSLLCLPAHAAEHSRTEKVYRVGTDGTNAWLYPGPQGFDGVTITGLFTNCASNTLLAFDPNTEQGRRFMTILLAAQISGNSVVVYYNDGASYCHGRYPRLLRLDISK
jgi:hypothetical protein